MAHRFVFELPGFRGVAAIATILAELASPSMEALAALDSPGSWTAGPSAPASVSSPPASSIEESHDAPWNLWQAHLEPKSSDLLMADPEKRIPELFSVPKEIAPQVRFWTEIYTRYTSREAVLFDEEHPEIIYEVVDFRNLARTSRNRAAYEIVSRQILRDRVAAYQRAFLSLGQSTRLPKNRRPRKSRALSREEAQILSVTRGLPHLHSWPELKKNLRVQWGQRDQVIQGLLASAPFRQRMDHVFEAMGLPRELTLLSLVESSFNPKAVSHAGAAGVWQFMPESGAEFMSVLVHQGIDERVSPIKSTAAAARLLQRNFRMLGSWPAAISAYNHGHGKWLPISRKERLEPGRLLAQCSKSRKLPARLGFASRNYYAEFLALLRADRYQELVFGPPPQTEGQAVRFALVSKNSRLEELAEVHGLAPHQLLELNPDILAAHSPIPNGFLLAIPAKVDDFGSVIRATKTREQAYRASKDSPRAAARRAALQAQASLTARGRRG